MVYDGQLYFPVVVDYPETTFGGDFATYADYRDPYLAGTIEAHGWMIWPPIRYDYRTINLDLPVPARRRPRPTTRSAPTIRAATCWRG